MPAARTKQAVTPPRLSLSVQYAVAEPRLPRWRLRRWVEQALRALPHEPALPHGQLPPAVRLTLRLVGAAEGRRLNREFRGRDYATNVLTFEYGADPEGTHHGDIVLCVPVLVREAREQRKPLLAHAAHLTVHGVLHALGFDHIGTDQALVMESLETRILAGMGVPDPYAAP